MVNDPDSPAEIARGLTEAQQEAVMSATETFGGEIQVWHSHRGTMKSLHRKDLCSEPNWKGCATETALGLAVRYELQKGKSDVS